MNRNTKIIDVKGIGEKTEKLFQKIGVYTVDDLLLNFPRDYERFPEPIQVSDVCSDQKQAVFARIQKTPGVNPKSRMQVATCDLTDGEKKLRLIWYRSPYVRALLKPGKAYVFYGKVQQRNGMFVMEQPEIFEPEKYVRVSKTLRPHYSLTSGLTNNAIQKYTDICLKELGEELEYLPLDIRSRNHLMEYGEALRNIHFPEREETCIDARRRLVFDEFLIFILSMQLQKEKSEQIPNHFDFTGEEQIADMVQKLPYELTGAQKRVLDDVMRDMKGEGTMQRLIQGDVGSGKTIVAFLAMIYASISGYQSAMMAPTEVLAVQHYEKLKDLCEEQGLRIPIVLLTGSMTAKQKRNAYEKMQLFDHCIIIGTHALIQERSVFRELALVITDEQHRFGVNQREQLANKGFHPHILVMSATPIPRTLAIILYGDLDISVMDEVPAKRLPIKNCVVNQNFRPKSYEFMRKELEKGHQCYVICPMVEESENFSGENVIGYAEKLQAYLGNDVQIGILHGKMNSNLKNQVMEQFLRGEIQILVSTTVVEVGVDVPNATVIMIENAERFGLAQLHQLRGRVGRGDAQSYCIMINTDEKNEKNRRLEILNQSNDGFYIANEDLKLRGPGDFFGIRQSGLLEFKLADVYQDADLLKDAAYEAGLIMAHPEMLQKGAYKRMGDRVRVKIQNDINL